MRLLTNSEREEVHRLLSFLYVVRGKNILKKHKLVIDSVSTNVVLSDRYSNDTIIQMKFANLIFPVCGQTMLKICLDRIDSVFS